jgi:hypothetical protein
MPSASFSEAGHWSISEGIQGVAKGKVFLGDALAPVCSAFYSPTYMKSRFKYALTAIKDTLFFRILCTSRLPTICTITLNQGAKLALNSY